MRGNRLYYEPQRRRALCRIQEDDGRLVPRDMTAREILGVLVGIMIVLGILVGLKIALGQ